MDQLERAGELKGELVTFALSDRFSGPLGVLIEDAFPGGLIDDEARFAAVLESFLFIHRLADGDRVVERFATDRPDLPPADKALLLGWRDYVQGVFRIGDRCCRDGVTAFNHVDELTYRIRSNMGPEGTEQLTPGTIMVGGIVPVGDDWMISGTPLAYSPEAADHILAHLPQLALSQPEQVFRNPEKLAQARELQAEQRQAFIDLHGGDLIVVPGSQLRTTMMELYRFLYERAGSPGGRWSEPELPLPDGLTGADSVALIYDSEDGLGFYPDFDLAREAFTQPRLLLRRRYREVLSGYLRGEGVSPVPIRRLVEMYPDGADGVFQTLLKRPGFRWSSDGEALLRRYKADWYAEPPLPRVVPVSGTCREA
jgi:hypothetical protein